MIEIQRGCGWGFDWWQYVRGFRLGWVAVHWVRADGYELAEMIVRARRRRRRDDKHCA